MADALPLPSLIQRYLNGESMLQLSKETGTASRTLYRWMLSESGPEYDSIITECLINRIADADDELGQAQDNCQVARAREIAKFARMDFERRRPKLYGPKQELEIDNKVTVVINRLGPVSVQSVQSIPDNSDSEITTGERMDANTPGDFKAGGGQ